MKVAEQRLIAFLRSAPCAVIVCGVALVMLLTGSTVLPPVGPSSALLKTAPAMVAGSLPVAIGIAASVMLVVVGIMLLTNRTFGIVRSTSKLFVGLFPLAVCATPQGPGLAMNPLLMCLVVMLSMMIMFTIYMRPASTRRVFIVFTMLSAGGCLSYGFIFFLPVMLLVAAQMRCLTTRSLLAALIGVITPLWILLGFGQITFGDFMAPDILWLSPESWGIISAPQLAAMGLLVIGSLTAMIFNVIKVYRFNARSRAFNGVLATLTLWTILFVIFDFGNAIDYLPLLSALGALQVALYFELDRSRRAYILVLLLVAAFISVFLWNLILQIS